MNGVSYRDCADIGYLSTITTTGLEHSTSNTLDAEDTESAWSSSNDSVRAACLPPENLEMLFDDPSMDHATLEAILRDQYPEKVLH